MDIARDLEEMTTADLQYLILMNALVESGDVKGVTLSRMMLITDAFCEMDITRPSVKISFGHAGINSPSIFVLQKTMDKFLDMGLISKEIDEDLPPEIKILDGERFIYRQPLYKPTERATNMIVAFYQGRNEAAPTATAPSP